MIGTTDDALRAARDILPGWVTWGPAVALPVGAFALTFLTAFGAGWFYSRPLVREPDAHWTERARHFYRVRVSLMTTFWMVFVIGIVWSFALANPVSPLADGVRAVFVFFGCDQAQILAGRALRSRCSRDPSEGWWRRQLVYALAFAPPLWIVVVLGACMPARPSPAWIAAGAILTVLALYWMIGGGLRVLPAIGLARRASASELGAADADVGGARLVRLDAPLANAFCYPWLRVIAVTERAIDALAPDELRAILMHEAGHLAEPRRMNVARLLPVAALLALGWWRPASALLGPWTPVVIVAAFATSMIVLQRFRHAAEVRADLAASGGDSPAFASALEKLHARDLTPAVLHPRATHPGLRDRMVAAGVTPSWRKPEPPEQTRLLMFVSFTVVCSALVVPGMIAADFKREPQDRGVVLRALAYGGGGARALEALAWIEYQHARHENALVLYHASAAADPKRPSAFASAAVVAANLGRCDAARADLERAERCHASRHDERDVEVLEEARQALAMCDEDAR